MCCKKERGSFSCVSLGREGLEERWGWLRLGTGLPGAKASGEGTTMLQPDFE